MELEPVSGVTGDGVRTVPLSIKVTVNLSQVRCKLLMELVMSLINFTAQNNSHTPYLEINSYW